MSGAVANVSESYGLVVLSAREGIVSPPILKLHDRDCFSLGSNLRTRCQNFQISCTCSLRLSVRTQDFHSWKSSSILLESTNKR